jgi:metacaspase-1
MKCALLIGINYTGTSAQLNGCINDINCIKDVLSRTFGYNKFVILTDQESMKPTRYNILTQLKKLVNESGRYSEIWIHYSGHGTYITDKNGDERDRRDEALVPLDYSKNGLVLDDELNQIIKNAKCQTRLVLDCCHSGTSFDMEHNVVYSRRRFRRFREKKRFYNRNNIYMISGCMDHQTSKESYNPVTSKVQGALTYNLCNYLKRYRYRLSIRRLMQLLSTNLSKYNQNPVVSSNKWIGIGRRFMIFRRPTRPNRPNRPSRPQRQPYRRPTYKPYRKYNRRSLSIVNKEEKQQERKEHCMENYKKWLEKRDLMLQRFRGKKI